MSRNIPRLMALPSALTLIVSVIVTDAAGATTMAVSKSRITSCASAGRPARTSRIASAALFNPCITLAELDFRVEPVVFVIEFEILGFAERKDVGDDV